MVGHDSSPAGLGPCGRITCPMICCLWVLSLVVSSMRYADMVSNNLTLSMKGDIPFRDLVKTFLGFQKLLDTIAQEIGAGSVIEWATEDLKGGSAQVTINGLSEDMGNVVKTVEATDLIFTRLSQNRTIPYSDNIVRQAKTLTHVINGKVEEISITAGDNETRITERVDLDAPRNKIYSRDAIKGVIDTLQRHRAFKFVLYDSLFGGAVTCYVSPKQEDEMREAWGKTVMVSGLVGRNSNTGKPIDIKNIWEISIVKDVPPGSYGDARGILDLGDRSPEAIIREFRNTQWDLPDGQ